MLIVLIRAILLYVLLIFSLRLMGKRQLGELQPSELCITILVSNIASIPIENPSIPLSWGVIPILLLVGFELITSYLAIAKPKIRHLISGNPVVVVADGVIDQKALKSLRFSIDDLTESLRTSGVFDLSEVDYAVVETNGRVSVLQKYYAQTITNQAMNLSGNNSGPISVIVSNGELVADEFLRCNLTQQWLFDILKKEKIELNDIFVMTLNKQQKYEIIKKQGWWTDGTT